MMKANLRVEAAMWWRFLAVALVAVTLSAPVSASSKPAVQVAQVFGPMSDGKTLPACSPTRRIELDCHIHEKATFLATIDAPLTGFPHARFEYEAWQRMYMTR